jgi:hypothetical protein
LNISPLVRIPEDRQLGELVRLYYYVLLVPEDVYVNGLVSLRSPSWLPEDKRARVFLRTGNWAVIANIQTRVAVFQNKTKTVNYSPGLLSFIFLILWTTLLYFGAIISHPRPLLSSQAGLYSGLAAVLFVCRPRPGGC